MAERIDSEIDIRPGKSEKDEVRGKKTVSSSTGDEGDEIEIEIVDDTPEGDRGRPRRNPNVPVRVPAENDDDEIGQYTERAQKRLKQMRFEYHEERRAKEAWQREHSAAVELAKKVYDENKKLRELVTKGHKTMLESTKAGAESEMSALQESLKAALESGETAKAAELQGKLARAAARAEAQDHIQPISFPKGEEEEEPQDQRRPARQEVRVSDSMQDWMAENPWFNQDKRMTAFAFGVHEDLIDKKVPLESPRYYQEINKAIREAFPNYFEEGEEDQEESPGRGNRREDRTTSRANGNTNGRSAPARRTSAVAGVTRSPAGRPSGKVTLTASQVALAKRLGITEQQYAREMIRLENQDG